MHRTYMFRKIFLLISLLATILILAAFIARPSDQPGPVIQTPQGPIKGLVTPNGVHNFKGLPFAAPPVGDLRWRPPVAASNWNDTRDASVFGNVCMQASGDPSGRER